jgi:hypothetical protein
MSTLSATQATFLGKIAKQKPLTDYKNAEEEFKNYLRREQKVLTHIGVLAKLPGAADDAKKLEREISILKLRLEGVVPLAPEEAKTHFHTYYEKLDSTKKDIKAKIKEYQDRSTELEQYKPLYDNRMKKLDAAVKQLEQRPGTKEHCDKLKEMEQEAKSKFDSLAPQKACEKLDKLDATVKKSWEASDSFMEKLIKSNDDVKAADDAWKKYKECMDDGQNIDKEGKKFLDELKKFAKPDDNQDTTNLKTLTGQWKHEVDRIEKDKDEAEKALKEVEKIIYGELKMAAPLYVYEPLMARLLEISADMGCRQYARAILDLGKLKIKAEEKENIHKPRLEEWKKLAAELPVKIGEAKKKAHKDKEAPGLVTLLADSMENQFPILQRKAEQTHEYQSAVAKANQMKQKLEQIEKDAAGYAKLETTYKDLKKAADSELDATKEKIEDLEKKGGDVSDFQKEFMRIKNAWVKVVRQATDDAAKIQKMKDFTDQTTILELKTLAGKVDLILNDKKVGLPANIQKAQDKKVLSEWDEVKKKITRDLVVMEIKDPDNHAKWDKEFKNALATWGSNTKSKQELLDDFKEVGQRIETNRKSGEAVRSRDAEENLKKAKELRNTIKEMSQSHLFTGDFSKNWKPYLESLNEKVLDCEALFQTALKTSIEEGKKTLDGLKDELDEAQKDIKDGEQDIVAEMLNINLLCDPSMNKDAALLDQFLPGRFKLLTYQLEKEVIPLVRQKPPKQALAELQKFRTKLEDAVQVAADRESELKTLENRAKALLKKVDALTEAPRLQKDLTKRLNAAAKPAENGEAGANVEMNAIEIILEDALHPNKKAGLEQGVATKELDAERAEAAYKGKLELFKKGPEQEAQNALKKAAKDAEGPVKDEVNVGAYEQIGAAVHQAEKMAKAKDFDQANAQIEEATRLAREFAKNPLGEQATSRHNLPKVKAAWHKAVSEFNRQIAQLKRNIADAWSPPLPMGKKKGIALQLSEVNKKLNAVGRSFDVTMFDKVIDVLANKGVALPERRHAKESGLRYLRNYRKIMKSDPVIKHLKNEVFGTNVAAALKFLDTKLRDLEVNLSGA